MDEGSISDWLQSPCAFYLSRSYATKCCACDKNFRFMSRGYTCEFCGYFCHKGRPCSRKMWLSKELLRRRICNKCDRYRKVCTQLRAGAEFTLYEKSCSKTVILQLSESRGELQILQNETRMRVDSIHINRLKGIRRGFSHGGHLRTINYDPLRSLTITVSKGKQEDSLTTYNLKAASAWACQMWVDGLECAKYVYRRMDDQMLAREWHESHGCSLYSAGSRLLHNYLPRNSEMKKLRREKRLAKNASMSLHSTDSGVEFPSSLDSQEGYVEIEVMAGNVEVLSREVYPSLLLTQHHSSSPLSCSQQSTHSSNTPSPTPSLTEDLLGCSTPGLPHQNTNSSPSSLHSCHDAFTMDKCSMPDLGNL